MPKWATPMRQLYLAQILVEYQQKIYEYLATGQKSGWQVNLLDGTVYHPELQKKIDQLVKNWIQADRENAQIEWENEYALRHKVNYRIFPIHGQFSGIAQDVYYDNQDLFYVIGIGISAINLKPFAKVRIASSSTIIHVDISDCIKSVSKNRKRKAIRYGKIDKIESDIYLACKNAVKKYLGI